MRLGTLRKKYIEKGLDEKDVSKNPVEQFSKWYKEALKLNLADANAMTFATATKSGKPSARIVLLKSFNDAGFIFYTNYKSRKCEELKENPQAALLFFWAELRRQVRIEGRVEKISKKQSEVYFHTRPRDTQIGAWASLQSNIIESRNALMKEFYELRKKFGDKEIPLPNFWGGFILIPHSIEFWQGRENRLHDRIVYTRTKKSPFEGGKGDVWKIERLAP